MKKQKIFFLILILLLALGSVTVGYAQTGGGYDLSWWTVDGGGGQLSGGGYTLSGTIGQPDVGDLSGGNYNLSGGFWSRLGEWVTGLLEIYLPLILR